MRRAQIQQILWQATQAAVICLFVSFLVGLILRTTDWGAFMMGTILYAVFVGGMSWPANRLLATTSQGRRRLAALGLAVASSYLWTLLFFGVLGGGIYPLFILQITFLYYWMLGGAAALLYSTTRDLDETEPVSLRQGLALLAFLPMICVGGTVLLGVTIATLADDSEHEIYLIPEGYRGPVMVVYEQPNGLPPRYDGSTRIYDIPPDGLLLTQSAPVASTTEFWYVDEQGQKTDPIVWGQNCVDEFSGDPVISCVKASLISISGHEKLPQHSLFIIGPLSQQADLAEGSSEWSEEHLIRLADQ